MIRGQSGQSVSAQMLTAATGAAFAGTVTVYVTIDAGTQAIGSVGSGLCTAEGNGLYSYLPSLAETDGAKVDFTFIGTGAVPVTIQYPTITLAQQAALLASSTVAGATSVQSICEAAAQELNIIMPGENLSANDGAVVLKRLNWLLGNWNTKRHALYTVTLTSYTLTPALQPHTIGPTGTFVVANRPVSIEAAHLVYTGGVRMRIGITTDPQDWADLSLPAQTSSLPSSLYYRPDAPNGSLFLWPVPDTAYGIELLTRAPFGQVLLTDAIELPDGYPLALTLSLAELIATPFGREVPPALEKAARMARADVYANHDPSPRLITLDAGMPGSRRWGRGSYLTRWT